MDNFQTHQDILHFLIKECNVDNVLETGMGSYSTRLFVENAGNVTSLEMQNQEWYQKIKEEFMNVSNFNPVLRLDQSEAYKFLDEQSGPYDLVFVDGALDRWRQVNKLFSKTKLMAVHDTEADGYLWKRVNLPSGWHWVDIKVHSPWTAVLTEDLSLIEKIKQNFPCSVYDETTFENKDYLIHQERHLQKRDWDIHGDPGAFL